MPLKRTLYGPGGPNPLQTIYDPKYVLTDVKTGSEARYDDIVEAIGNMDRLRSLGHDVEMVNVETGQTFHWRGQ